MHYTHPQHLNEMSFADCLSFTLSLFHSMHFVYKPTWPASFVICQAAREKTSFDRMTQMKAMVPGQWYSLSSSLLHRYSLSLSFFFLRITSTQNTANQCFAAAFAATIKATTTLMTLIVQVKKQHVENLKEWLPVKLTLVILVLYQ